MWFFQRIVFLASYFAMQVVAANAINDPSEHFGGSDNDIYLDWVGNIASQTYTATFYLASEANETEGIAIHWDIVGDEYLHLAVAARATGFLGLGIAEAGGMEGADLLLYETAYPVTVRDAHVLDERYPVTDDCQDWQCVDSFMDAGFLIVQVERLLDTGDPQDRKIVRDNQDFMAATRIIGAWGPSPYASYHGPNRVRGAVRWTSLGGTDERTLFARQNDRAG
jgi:hypothetical protein